jgi:hypothetical protein
MQRRALIYLVALVIPLLLFGFHIIRWPTLGGVLVGIGAVVFVQEKLRKSA